MKHELCEKGVAGAQYVSSLCFVCGIDNKLSLNAQFLDLEDGSICGLFTTLPEHQGYPDRVHGGVIGAILDETIGRAVQTLHPEIFGVTIELTVRYRAPVPLGEQLKVIARVEKQNRRVFEGSGELLLPDGTVAAQGFAKYMRADVDSLIDGGLESIKWIADERPLPETIEA